MQAQRNLMESLSRIGLTTYESEAYVALVSERELTAEEIAKYPPADFTIERIGDFLKFDLETLLKGSKPAA